jgi:hypothetical protein
VVGASDLRGFVSSLLEPLSSTSKSPLCTELDKLLAQLSSVSLRTINDDEDQVKSNASHLIHSVASFARKISTEQHSPIKDSIDALSSQLPCFLTALNHLEAALATSEGCLIPDETLHAAVLDPCVILNDPMLTQAAHKRGRLLMQHLDAIVDELAGERVAQLQDLASSLYPMLIEVEALSSAAQSAAAAIQSEHNVDSSPDRGGGKGAKEVGKRAVGDKWGFGGDAGRRMDEESRNAFAAHALKRCVQKLEGKDVNLLSPDAAPSGDAAASSVAQQADRLIRMATSEDSLSQMFEGWMAWI